MKARFGPFAVRLRAEDDAVVLGLGADVGVAWRLGLHGRRGLRVVLDEPAVLALRLPTDPTAAAALAAALRWLADATERAGA